VFLEDSAALMGTFLAFLGLFLGQTLHSCYFDPAASILIGLLLAAVALLLGRESGALLAQLADRTYDALESGLQETEAGRLKRRAVHEGDSVESASFLTTEINLNSLWASKKGRPSTSLRL